MGLFTRAITAEPLQAPAHNAGKKIILSFGGHPSKAVLAMAAATLEAGGYVEPSPREPEIGDEMPDGTIYAGTSPDTGKAMYTTPADATLTMTFNEAKEYASQLDVHGHQDWRVPSKNELNVLFNNRAAIGGFNVSGSRPAGWCWSASSDGGWSAWAQRFSDGRQYNGLKDDHSAVRCVR